MVVVVAGLADRGGQDERSRLQPSLGSTHSEEGAIDTSPVASQNLANAPWLRNQRLVSVTYEKIKITKLGWNHVDRSGSGRLGGPCGWHRCRSSLRGRCQRVSWWRFGCRTRWRRSRHARRWSRLWRIALLRQRPELCWRRAAVLFNGSSIIQTACL